MIWKNKGMYRLSCTSWVQITMVLRSRYNYKMLGFWPRFDRVPVLRAHQDDQPRLCFEEGIHQSDCRVLARGAMFSEVLFETIRVSYAC